jgi:hypothetical protein
MILSIILILLIILGIGLPLTLLVCPKLNRFSALGLSFPLGIGIFTLVMFITNLAGVRFSLLNEVLLLLLISVPLTFFGMKQIKIFFVDLFNIGKNLDLSSVEKIIFGALILLVVLSFVYTLYWPVYLWDSLVLYDFRAHIFAQSGFMKDAFIDSYYFGYPLLTSLAHTIVYLAGGKYPQFLYSLFYFSLGVSFYGFLREFISRKLSLLSTLILLIAQPLFYHSLISYTNLPFTVYLSLGSLCVYLWDKKRERGYLILSALLIGLSTWTRSVEPFWLAILLVVFLTSIYRKKIWNIVVYSLFFFPIHEIWKVFQNSIRGSSTTTVTEVASYGSILPKLLDMNKWGMVIVYLYKYVALPWGAIFAVFVLVTISLFILKKQKEFFLIFFITFALLAVLLAGTFAFSLGVENWFAIGDAAQRLSMLFYPFFVYCIALVLYELCKKNN